MSLLNIDELTPQHQLAQYVLEFRGQGHCLPYQDYEILKEWFLASAGDHDRLLLILSDVLPDYFNRPGRNLPPDLKGVRKKVLKRIKESLQKVECRVSE